MSLTVEKIKECISKLIWLGADISRRGSRQSAHHMVICEESCYNSRVKRFDRLVRCEVKIDKNRIFVLQL